MPVLLRHKNCRHHTEHKVVDDTLTITVSRGMLLQCYHFAKYLLPFVLTN